LLFDAGFAADQGRKSGTANFTTSMLTESTRSLDSVEVEKRMQRLGALLDAECDLDSCDVTLNALNAELTPSLTLMADMVRRPAFKATDIERLRRQWLSAIAQEQTEPGGLARRILPPLLYGKSHAYGVPFTGTGTPQGIRTLNRNDLLRFQREVLRPDNLRILVAGDTTLAQIVPQLNAVFGDWQPAARPIPQKNIATVKARTSPRVFLINRADAPQTLILAGLLAPSSEAGDALDLSLGNSVFGGGFSSRLNMNLREDKHWAYGASSMLATARGQRPMLFYAPVQTDKTAEAITEIQKELRELLGDRPLTDDEIVRVKSQSIRALPGKLETTGAVLNAMTDILVFHHADDYVNTLKTKIEAIDQASAQAALSQVIKPEGLTWVIVGDLKQIEPSVRALNLGPVEVLNNDGRRLR
jgi:predicted Zn-dependent peptidase